MTALGTSVAGYFLLRNKLSHDKLEISKNDTEYKFIQQLESSRQQSLDNEIKLRAMLNAVQSDYSEATLKNNQLSQDIDTLLIQVKILNNIIQSMHNQLVAVRNDLVRQIKKNDELVKKLAELGVQL
jgi:hypothetical protein